MMLHVHPTTGAECLPSAQGRLVVVALHTVVAGDII